jgi:hypothetical protein
VSTNSDENRPIANAPAQASRSAQARLRRRRAIKVIGINSAEAASSTTNSAAPSGSAGTTRAPT